jgi:hypothetical protein
MFHYVLFRETKLMQDRNDIAKYEWFVINEFEHFTFCAAITSPYNGKAARHLAKVAE